MEARGKYGFTATSEDELSFNKGDVIKILSEEDDWCKAEMNGHEGYVPRNYIEWQVPGWFQETATRVNAEEFLRHKDVGEFVVRGCQRSPAEFSMSVKDESEVQHFRVMRDNKGQYFLWSKKFPSVNKLVEFYKTTSISKARQIFLKDGISDSRVSTTTQKSSTMQVVALYDFTVEEDDELGFCAGDIIEVIDGADPSWWKGRLRGNSGLFPANYTKQL